MGAPDPFTGVYAQGLDAYTLASLVTKGPTPSANLLAFGAVPDGSTNNATALQAAITAIQNAGGGKVYVPPVGQFNFSSRLEINHDDVIIEGDGYASHLHQTDSSQWGFRVSNGSTAAHRATFRNFRLTGPQADAPHSTPGTNHGIALIGGTGHRIENVWVEDFGSTGIRLTSKNTANALLADVYRVRDALVTGCRVERCQTGIAAFIGVYDSTFRDNLTYRNWYLGFFADDASVHDEAEATPCERLNIIGHRDRECGWNNTSVDFAVTGIAVVNTYGANLTDCWVSDPVYNANHGSNGIIISTQQYNHPCREISLRGCKVYRTGGDGIRVEGVKDATLTDCWVENAGYLDDSIAYFNLIVTKVQFDDPGDDPDGGLLSIGCERVKILGCTFLKTTEDSSVSNLVKLDGHTGFGQFAHNYCEGTTGPTVVRQWAGRGIELFNNFAPNLRAYTNPEETEFLQYPDNATYSNQRRVETALPVTLTASQTLDGTNDTVWLDSTDAGFAVKLPSAPLNPKVKFLLRRIAGANSVGVEVVVSGGNINGGSSLTISDDSPLRLESDGANWWST